MNDKKVRIQLSVEVPYDTLIDEDSLREDYGGSMQKFIQELYDQEGQFWDGELKLGNVEVVEIERLSCGRVR